MHRGALFVGVGIVLGCVAPTQAQTPLGSAFTYQGRLENAGTPVTGPHDLRFTLLNAASGGSTVGSAVCADNVAVQEGLFTTPLDFGAAAFNGEARWLQVEVRADTGLNCSDLGGFVSLAPPVAISAAPYALQTRGVFASDAGLIGIGTNAPAVRLHVNGGSDAAPTGGGYVVSGDVLGLNVVLDNNEIMARDNGVASDLYMCHNGGNLLIGTGAGGANVGIGTTLPTLGKVQVSVTNQRALYATNNSATLATGYFVNGGAGPAGVFDGNLTVIGSLSKSSGSFRIDHPLDPANRYLYHSFVESPDMMNVYNGNVVTDGRGYATITMPEWFEVLNRDFRYQLTVLDAADGEDFVHAKVVGKMRDNRFMIRTSAPGAEVSWQVTGIRHDPWAQANRIPVEQSKAPHERGRYQHPELYGLPRDMGLSSAPGAEYHAPGHP